MSASEPTLVEPLVTLPELAGLLRVPVATVYRWRRYGRGPRGYRVGRGIRFRVSEVEEWLQAQREVAS